VATGAADARSDVYAAGVMLYELLTGAPPYQGDTAISVAYRHVNTDMPAPSLIAGDVPPELDALVLHATRRDPAARPADAGAMLAELRDVARRLEVPRVPPPAPPVEDQHTEPSVAKAAEGPRGTRALPRPPAENPPSHVDARRHSRRVFAVWIAIVLVLALIVGVSAWWLGSGRWTEVPRIAGVERTAAERMLTEADLVPNVKVAYDNDVPAGRVAVTNPLPDAQLLRGSSVAVTVSNGRPTVPQIAPGTPVEEAEAAVRAVTLTPERSGSRSDQRTGTVASTEPAAGTALPIGGTVTLVLGDGDDESDQVRVPSLVGQSYESASEKLSDLGLDVEQSRGLLGRRNGIVIGQSPSPGELVDKGTTVTLHTF
jgi:eukaryotic-like serine/threonine-protein kinase